MKLTTSVILSAILSIVMLESESQACDSAMAWTLPLMIEKADRIVVAKATSHTTTQVIRALRGDTSPLPPSKSNCDPHLNPGSHYLIFLQGGGYFTDSASVRLIGDPGKRVIAFVKAYNNAGDKKSREAVRVRTIAQEMQEAQAGHHSDRLLRDVLGHYPSGLVTTKVDRRVRAVLAQRQQCKASALDWFKIASSAPNVGIFKATQTGSSLISAWRGSRSTSSIPKAIPGATYLLVRDAVGLDRTPPILLDGDVGDHVRELRTWLEAPSKKVRSQALMSYLRNNAGAVVQSNTCEEDPRKLVLDALLELGRIQHQWKAQDCALLQKITAGLHRRDLVAPLHKRCKRSR